jgi:hypothetical protein
MKNFFIVHSFKPKLLLVGLMMLFAINAGCNPIQPHSNAKLDETFIKQIEQYIPEDERIEFIKDYVRPHTQVNISFNEKIITGTGQEPFFRVEGNKIVPPYLKWKREGHRAKIRFANDKWIKYHLLQVEVSIAIPVVQWLNKENGNGILRFVRDGRPDELFKLAPLQSYKFNQDYNYDLSVQTESPIVSFTLPDEIDDLETFKRLTYRGNSLTIRYLIDGMSFNRTIERSDLRWEDEKIKVSLPAGNYKPTQVTIEPKGIFLLFSFQQENKPLSFKVKLKELKSNVVYPSYYSENDKKICNPLKGSSNSNIVTKIIENPDLTTGKCMGKSPIKTQNCPFLTMETVSPCIENGEIVLDLTKVTPLQVKFMLGSKDKPAANWLLVENERVTRKLPETGQIELIDLPKNDFRLEPPAHLITLNSIKISNDLILKKAKDKMKMEDEDKKLNTSHVKTVKEFRWPSYSNPLVIDLGTPKERLAQSHLPVDSLWAKIKFGIQMKGQEAYQNCSIQKNTRIVCPNVVKSLNLKDLIGAVIMPVGLVTMKKSEIRENQLIDILCGRWNKIFDQCPGIDIYVPSKVGSLEFQVVVDGKSTQKIYQSFIEKFWWGELFCQQNQAPKVVLINNQKPVILSEKSAIFEFKGGKLIPANVAGNSTWLHCKDISPLPTTPISDNSKATDTSVTQQSCETDICVDLVLVATQGYHNSRQGWTTFFAQQKGHIAKAIVSKQCDKSISLWIHALYLNRDTKEPYLKKMTVLTDLNDSRQVFAQLDKMLNEVLKLDTLSRPIKNQIPVILNQVMPSWKYDKDHRVGILLHGDKIEDDLRLKIQQIAEKLQDRQTRNQNRIVILSRRDLLENRIPLTNHYIMKVDGKWVNDFFTDLLKCE